MRWRIWDIHSTTHTSNNINLTGCWEKPLRMKGKNKATSYPPWTSPLILVLTINRCMCRSVTILKESLLFYFTNGNAHMLNLEVSKERFYPTYNHGYAWTIACAHLLGLNFHVHHMTCYSIKLPHLHSIIVLLLTMLSWYLQTFCNFSKF